MSDVPDLVTDLPLTTVHGSAPGHTQLDDECPICTDNLVEATSVALFCGHRFHHTCVADWFESNNTRLCPVCKKKH